VPKAWTFGCRGRNHLWADAGRGRRQCHPL